MKNKNPLSAVLTIILLLILGYGLSWAVCVGIIKIIALCFGWGFNLAHATGCWLIGVIATVIWSKLRKGRKE